MSGYWTAPPPPAPPPQPYHDPRPRLDQYIDQMRAHDPAPWGWKPVVIPCAALVVLIVGGNLVGHFVNPNTFTAALIDTILLTATLYGALITALYYAGRDLARRYAGWGWAFGLQWPRRIDAAWVAAGVGLVLVGRIAVVIVANSATHGRAGEQAQNLDVNSTSPAVYAVLGVIVVLIAPLVEETMFRGLLLRTFMRRLGFWPGALLSSLIFALFHTYEVDTLTGAVTLAGVVFVLGLTNCLLVRWSGRLAPGMIVHALFNGLAIVVLVVQNS
jgi:membrane protease YdiL (CAAX protease family)